MSADEHEGYIFGEAPSIAAATKDRQAALDARHAGANVAEVVGGRVRRFVCDCCEPPPADDLAECGLCYETCAGH